jgi:hypothetical protein
MKIKDCPHFFTLSTYFISRQAFINWPNILFLSLVPTLPRLREREHTKALNQTDQAWLRAFVCVAYLDLKVGLHVIYNIR